MSGLQVPRNLFIFVNPSSRCGPALMLQYPVLVVESALDLLTRPCQFSLLLKGSDSAHCAHALLGVNSHTDNVSALHMEFIELYKSLLPFSSYSHFV